MWLRSKSGPVEWGKEKLKSWPPPSCGRRPRHDYRRRSPPPPTHLQDGEPSPSARAGPFLDIGEERDPCPRREITSRPGLS